MATVEGHFGKDHYFTPRDEISEASKIFAAMSDLPSGSLLSYDDLDRVLGREFKDNRSPWFDALNRWHRDVPEGGTWKNVPKIGYQHVADWGGVKETGEAHQKKVKRQVKKSKQRYLSADLSKMDDAQKRDQADLLVRVGRLEAASKSHKADIRVLRKTKAEKSDVAALQDQMQALTEAVEKIIKTD